MHLCKDCKYRKDCECKPIDSAEVVACGDYEEEVYRNAEKTSSRGKRTKRNTR